MVGTPRTIGAGYRGVEEDGKNKKMGTGGERKKCTGSAIHRKQCANAKGREKKNQTWDAI